MQVFAKCLIFRILFIFLFVFYNFSSLLFSHPKWFCLRKGVALSSRPWNVGVLWLKEGPWFCHRDRTIPNHGFWDHHLRTPNPSNQYHLEVTQAPELSCGGRAMAQWSSDSSCDPTATWYSAAEMATMVMAVATAGEDSGHKSTIHWPFLCAGLNQHAIKTLCAGLDHQAIKMYLHNHPEDDSHNRTYILVRARPPSSSTNI